jgi:hypothetical protein
MSFDLQHGAPNCSVCSVLSHKLARNEKHTAINIGLLKPSCVDFCHINPPGTTFKHPQRSISKLEITFFGQVVNTNFIGKDQLRTCWKWVLDEALLNKLRDALGLGLLVFVRELRK